MTFTEQLVVEEHCERDEWMVLDSPFESCDSLFPPALGSALYVRSSFQHRPTGESQLLLDCNPRPTTEKTEVTKILQQLYY